MRFLILTLVLLGTSSWSNAYSAYQRMTSSSSSSSSASSSPTVTCCKLTPWAYENMDVVRQMADRLRQDYNTMSRGGYSGRYSNQGWSESFTNAIGKTNEEMDAVCKQISEQIISDMQGGRITYGVVAQPNYFESQAAMALEKLTEGSDYNDNQQQQVELYEPVIPQMESTDLRNFDQVRHVNLPTEVKVVNGQTYITNKNYTTATMRGGSSINPIITTVRVNRTTTHTTVPLYGSQGTTIAQPFINNREHSIYSHLNRQEVGVPNYTPEVTVDDSLVAGMHHMNTYTPPIVIPVEGGDQVETIGIGNQYGIRPGHTVTIRKYNRTIITGPDGVPVVTGSESKSIWDNGQLVYNYNAPFGNVSWTKDDIWKREERERLFWIFQKGSVNIRDLEEWQRNQEERLLGLAYRTNKTIEEIEEWQRQELERYKVLINQYNTANSELTEWQKSERGRIDWLIHQNGITIEELERWQKENQQKLNALARQYRISIEELKEYQRQELNRLHVIFNQQNSQISSNNLKVFQQQESDRLNAILLQHNSTVDQLQEQIRRDQERYKDLAKQYRLNVEDMEKFFKSELNRLTSVINQQQEEMRRITDWQRSERARMEDIVRRHNLTVEELEQKMRLDRTYLQGLAQKYHISLEELEQWQRSELDRLHETGKVNLQKELEVWQQQERERMLAIIKKNDLTIEEYESKIGNDRARLQQLASMYQVQVEEIERWLREEAQRLKNEGVFSDVQKNLTLWQQHERDRLQAIVQNNELTIEELQNKIKNDQTRLYSMANTYQVRVEEIEDWLKKELVRLQSQGLVKIDDLKDWQKTERQKILQLVQDNKLTVEEFEKRLLSDKNRLQRLAAQYHVELKDIESWLRKESDRLQSIGLIEEEKLTEWQKIERDRLLVLVQKNQLSIDDLEKKIKSDQVHLYSLARQYSVRVEEIEEWLKKEVLRLQNQAKLDALNLKDWQKIERERIMRLVNQNDLTIDEFTQKLKADRAYLQQLAMQYHVEIEEVEEWAKNEGTRLESLGLIKANAPLTEWQEVERDHVLQVVQGQDQLSLDQLEERLKNDRAHLFSVAQEYKVQVQEIEEWIKKELQRLQNQGVVQIEKLKEWQQAERDRLNVLVAQQQDGFSVDEFEKQLTADRMRLQNLAWQNNVQVKEIEEWIHKELERMKAQGHIQIETLTEWQKNERDRLLLLAQQQSDLTAAELEKKLQADRNRLDQLARQYHVEEEEVENWIRKEVQKLRDEGKLQIEHLNTWQLRERDRLQELIKQQSQLSSEDIERQLKTDRNRLQQLAWQYHIQLEEVEDWIRKESQRLRDLSALHIGNLTDWQVNERQRIQQLLLQNSDLTVEEFENQLKADRDRLQQLAWQHHVEVEEVEKWIKKELQRLRNDGQLKIENLTAWQKTERNRLLQLAQQQSKLSLTEFEDQLVADRRRLEALANQYHISVQEIEEWLKKEAERLENQGVIGNLQEWQKLERLRIQDLIKQNNLTIEEFQDQIKTDHGRLQQLAWQYHVTVEEVEEWILNEVGRQIKPQALTAWQQNEQQRIRNLIQTQDLTLEQLEQQLKTDRGRLQQIAQQYRVTIDEITEWIRREGKRLIKPEPLTAWQTIERQRLVQQLQQPQSLTIDQLEDQLRANRYRLQQVAQQYHVTVEEVEEWIRREGKRLIKPQSESLTVWQENERQYLQQLLNQRPGITIEEWENQLRTDRNRLQQLARQYHITVEEIEEWVRNEGKRLIEPAQINEWQRNERDRLIHLLQLNQITLDELKQQIKSDRARLQQLAYQYHVTIEEIEEWIMNEGKKLIKPIASDNLTQWQQHEREYLLALANSNLVTQRNFEQHLDQDKQRMDNVAAHYQISVEEIKDFLRGEVQRLMKLRLISAGEEEIVKTVYWQTGEEQHIQELLQQHNWSIEELERKLRDDRARLQQLADQYRITIDQIEEWYRVELQKLLQQKKIYTENLTDWQKREKERMYLTIKQQRITIEELERQLGRDRNALRRLAAQYRVTIDQLINWQRKELGRLGSLGLGKSPSEGTFNAWQIIEKKRLRAIPVKVIITKEELQEFFATDINFQGNLTQQYNVSAEELKLFQGQELQNMKNEGVLETITLKKLTDWQRRERDRLYSLIRTQSFSSKNLKDWQSRDRLTMIGSLYRIPAETIKIWQIEEMQRIEGIAKHYKMNLNRLEDFRHGELERLKVAAHQSALSEGDLQKWAAREESRLNVLNTRTGLSGSQLDKWRRKLFLLAQGLIDLDFNEGGYGGIELNTNTSASAKLNETISKDRGDQPPQVYQEEMEESEPSLGSPSDLNAPMVQMTEVPFDMNSGPPYGHGHGYGRGRGHGHGHGHRHGPGGPPFDRYYDEPNHHGPPRHGPPHPHQFYAGPNERIQSERIHRKKEYTFTVPVDVPAPVYGNMEADSMTQNDQDDGGQQQVQVEDWNPQAEVEAKQNQQQVLSNYDAEDLGQQVQQEEDFGQLVQKEEDFGQQVQQEEMLVDEVSSSQKSSNISTSNTSQTDHKAADVEMIVTGESVTEEPKSVWGKLKTSAQSWFG